MKRTMKWIVLIMCLVSAPVFANSEVKTKKEQRTIAVSPKLQELIGEPIQRVSKSKLAGLYEVITATNIFYTNKEQTFVVLNSVVVGVEKKNNMSQERNAQLGPFKFDDLPLEQAVKTVRGNGSRVFVTWEDANCGYCKRFLKVLDEVPNTTVYTFVVGILSEDSKEKAKNIWCAADKSKVWTEWMGRNVPIPSQENCSGVPTIANEALMKKYRIQGTPAIFFQNGERIPGMTSAAQIESKLSQIKAPN